VTRRRALAAAATAVAALAGAGCGGGGDRPRTVRSQTTTTRVEVLQDSGDAQAGARRFDPAAIYRRESPGVVTVISTGVGGGGDSGLGSGFVVSGSGEIATNAHVVTSGEGASIRKAAQVYVRFKDDNEVPATIVGFDPFSDVALLRVDPGGLTLRPLPLGSARDAIVGAPVAAIGSPFGEDQSLSVGVISALDRSIDSLTGFATVGAMLDARGRVLGINAQIQTSSGEGSGVGFAVSIDTVKRSLSQLRRDGRVRYAFLGVTTSPVYPQLAQRFGLPVEHGAWVEGVTPGGPADRAGLRAGDHRDRCQNSDYVVGGDVIVSVGGHPIHEEDDVAKALVQLAPGRDVDIQVVRGAKRRKLKVKLGERPLASTARSDG
jgi:S1-C subfamily serine protease